NLDLVAIHAHSGFPLRTSADLDMHVDAVLDAVFDLAEQTEWLPTVLDLGGSLVCAVTEPPEAPTPLSIAEGIERSEARVAGRWPDGRSVPALAFEPGKALTAHTQLLLASVLDVADDIADDGSDGVATVTLDIGVGLAEPLRGEHHDVYNVTTPRGAPSAVRLVGPGGVADQLTEPMLLAQPSVGDVLAVMDTGAYFVPFSRAGDRHRPAIVVAEPDGEVTVARLAESTAHTERLERSAVAER
ncbi:MAG: hypothetical protein AAGG08_02940, partial [Actinomycetota bacterium]